MTFVWKRFDPALHHRRSIRLKGHDYSGPGLYFITVNTAFHEPLFGQIERGLMVLNEYGIIVKEEWLKTAVIRPYVQLDEFVVMPDHFHGIIRLTPVGATWQVAPTGTPRPNGPKPGSIGAIIGQFKMQTTKRIRNIGATRRVAPTGIAPKIWQRDYYERIILSDKELETVRNYIRKNPERYKKKSPGRIRGITQGKFGIG